MEELFSHHAAPVVLRDAGGAPASGYRRATAAQRLAMVGRHEAAPFGAAEAIIAPISAPMPHRGRRCVAAAQSAGLVVSGRREVVLSGWLRPFYDGN